MFFYTFKVKFDTLSHIRFSSNFTGKECCMLPTCRLNFNFLRPLQREIWGFKVRVPTFLSQKRPFWAPKNNPILIIFGVDVKSPPIYFPLKFKVCTPWGSMICEVNKPKNSYSGPFFGARLKTVHRSRFLCPYSWSGRNFLSEKMLHYMYNKKKIFYPLNNGLLRGKCHRRFFLICSRDSSILVTLVYDFSWI